MQAHDLLQTIARLESKLDQVETELTQVHDLLLNCGFPEGIHTLKQTIRDLLTYPPSDLDEES